MLFSGLGTGLGSTLIMDRIVVPLSLGNLPFRPAANVGHYLAGDAPSRLGKKRWQSAVAEAVRIFARAFETDYIVLGGGKAGRKAWRKRKRLHRRLPYVGAAVGSRMKQFLARSRSLSPGSDRPSFSRCIITRTPSVVGR